MQDFFRDSKTISFLPFCYEELPVDETLRLIETPGAPLDWARVTDEIFQRPDIAPLQRFPDVGWYS